MIAKRAMGWAPAPLKRLPPPAARPNLGQQSALSSREVAIAADIAVLTGSSFMVWGTTVEGNKWSTFWWIVSGITFMKILHDVSRPA
jgi:hypothetical protein